MFDESANERKKLIECLKDAVAHKSDDSLELAEYSKNSEAIKFLSNEKNIDMALLEIKDDQDIQLAQRTRETQEDADILLIAESSISPMEYLNPRIKAGSLLLRPFNDFNAKSVINDFIAEFYHKQQSDDQVLIIENRQGKHAIPLSRIYYIEIREKKVYIRLQDKEYWQYGTLDEFLNKLPKQFIRCHRSFAFNSDHLVRVKLSENIIYLEHGIDVPLSRSYKAAIKEFLDGLHC